LVVNSFVAEHSEQTGKVMKRVCLFSRIIMLCSLLFASSKEFARSCQRTGYNRLAIAAFSSPTRPSGESSTNQGQDEDVDADYFLPPWNHPSVSERATKKNALRSRQHVNPLARRFQMPTLLSPDWPKDTFNDMSRPLFLDIGCAKGGFMLDVAKANPEDYNYLGLEIRPLVAYHAQERVERHGLTGHLGFVGCNANVDLERLLTLYDAQDRLQMTTIQYPDPHFKAQHAKRRVVTPELVTALAKFMPMDATVFLQSDVQSVLDEMRLEFRQQPELFQDQREGLDEYLDENLIGIPTEREVSVLERGLPVYRSIFKRTSKAL
jgi:tRNA (guanine-N7-)-methyltransferase